MGQAQLRSAEHSGLTEPAGRSPRFLVGRNREGTWIARDRLGLRGGLFIDRANAVRFALTQNGNLPQEVVMVPGTIELGNVGRR
jgi:hypothetical protein